MAKQNTTYKDFILSPTGPNVNSFALKIQQTIVDNSIINKNTDFLRILTLVQSGTLNNTLPSERIEQMKIRSQNKLTEEANSEVIWVFGKTVNNVKPKLTAPFNQQRTSKISGNKYLHKGVDLSTVYGTGDGSEIVAAWPGQVVIAGPFAGFGQAVVLRHKNSKKIGGITTNTFVTIYGHLNKINVNLNDVVKQGDLLGIEGNTGLGSSGTHLHFEIRPGLEAGGAIDPVLFLDKSEYSK